MIVLVVTLASLLVGAAAFLLVDGSSPEASPLVAVLSAIGTALACHVKMAALERRIGRRWPDPVAGGKARAGAALPAIDTGPPPLATAIAEPAEESPPAWTGPDSVVPGADIAPLPTWPPEAGAPPPPGIPAADPAARAHGKAPPRRQVDPSQLRIDLGTEC